MLTALVLATHLYADAYLPAAPAVSSRRCAPIDYRPVLPAAKSQGDTGFCFSYTSADLINQRLGVNVSALDLAMAFYFADAGRLRRTREPALREYLTAHPRFEQEIEAARAREDVAIDGQHPFFHHLEGGFEAPALLLANTRGLCDDSKMRSEGGFREHMDVLAFLENRASRGVGVVGKDVARLHPRFRDGVADLFHTEWLRYVQVRCGHRPPPIALLPLDFAIAANSADFLRGRTEGRLGDAEQEQVLARVDYALDHARVAAIGLDLNTLLKATQDGDDGDHSVTVVGRRPSRAGCEYLVRDSSGYECGDFQSGIGRRCTDRHLWLKESELKRSLYSVTYLR